MDPEFPSFLDSLQKACLPGVWSKGVAAARAGAVELDADRPAELILRVKDGARPVSAKVSLWPGDDDYFCDCQDRADPCAHVAAAVAALKQGLRGKPRSTGAAEDSTRFRYAFRREGSALAFDRFLGTERFTGSLIERVGGQRAGRIAGPPLTPTQDDFAIDAALGEPGPSAAGDRAILPAPSVPALFRALRDVPGLTFEGSPVAIGPTFARWRLRLRFDGSPSGRKDLRVERVEPAAFSAPGAERFTNGVLRVGDVLSAITEPALKESEAAAFAPPGMRVGSADLPAFLARVLPELERRIEVEPPPEGLPTLDRSPPRIELRLDRPDRSAEDRLVVVPVVKYATERSVPDPAAERALALRLQSELHLAIAQRREFRGEEAVEFLARAKEKGWAVSGEAGAAFIPERELAVDFSADGKGFHVAFRAPSGRIAAPPAVFRAFADGASRVRLVEGGYAALPRDFLRRYGARLQRLFDARLFAGPGGSADGARIEVPGAFVPELADLASELAAELAGARIAPELARVRAALGSPRELPSAPLPADLRAELRAYQRDGVNWLRYLGERGLGALLADDMGLGKTLQTLCAVDGRTLIVAPTSVVDAWREQIARFRPSLRVSVYRGAERALDERADVTLTTYGVLRSSRAELAATEWATVVLDEAQAIKNPDSQAARAACALRARSRIALSGTPVENRLADLWSVFRFLNPGLLGPLADFTAAYAGAAGEDARAAEAARRLRGTIAPFILRRLKRDVAPELPPRTEVVLRAELEGEEAELYAALLAASRNAVLAELDAGGSVFGALERLLRLRQACCHPALVPGQRAVTSAKLELLAETLRESLALGHRALVFSQWTSFLDLIEVRLRAEGMGYARLDGGTRDRGEVVARFQSDSGPPVLLISLKAGGAGLTLTRADHVFLMDTWWNPAAEDQAADRAHRIGQVNPVLIHRLIARGTVEEKILELQAEKRRLAAAALAGEAAGTAVTAEDVRKLLG